MTYYGRWTYKFEEAARQGAAAAIIVHETIPAAYGYQVVRNSNSGNKSWLAAKDKNASMVPIQGWITLDTAQDLFKRAGLDYAQEKAAANKPGFKAVPMTGETLDRRCPFGGRASEDAQRGRRHSGLQASERRRAVLGALGSSRHQAGRRPDRTRSTTAPSTTAWAFRWSSSSPRPSRTTSVRSAPSGSCSGRWRSRACWARNISRSIRSGRATISWAC